jgi:hypothetical protein
MPPARAAPQPSLWEAEVIASELLRAGSATPLARRLRGAGPARWAHSYQTVCGNGTRTGCASGIVWLVVPPSGSLRNRLKAELPAGYRCAEQTQAVCVCGTGFGSGPLAGERPGQASRPFGSRFARSIAASRVVRENKHLRRAYKRPPFSSRDLTTPHRGLRFASRSKAGLFPLPGGGSAGVKRRFLVANRGPLGTPPSSWQLSRRTGDQRGKL